MMLRMQLVCFTLSLVFIGLAAMLFTDGVSAFIGVPRSWIMFGYKHRAWLLVGATLPMLAALGLNLQTHMLGMKTLVVVAAAFGPALFLAHYVIPMVMLRSQHHASTFVPLAQAAVMLQPDAEVFVIEHNGDARAFPHDWMVQPHVAGDTIGGTDLAMTVCGLSHLGLAYHTKLDGNTTDLKVFNQINNNLVLYDANSDAQPFQQIYGVSEDGTQSLEPHPSLLMPFQSFAELFPDGSVYFNPPEGLFDGTLSAVMLHVLQKQHTDEAPTTPMRGLAADASVLPLKTKVYGVQQNGEAAAWTQRALEEAGIVNTVVGGVPVALVYHSKYRFASAFDRRSTDGTAVDVREIDPHGRLPDGRVLRRIPFSAQVFWMVWKRYYPETRLAM